jgi:single-strand DNA-binding protein
MIVVVGSLQVRNWQDKDGNNRRTAEVVADEVYFGDSKRSGDDSGSRFTRTDADFGDQTGDRSFDSFSSSPYSSGLPVSDFEDITDDDDELPF